MELTWNTIELKGTGEQELGMELAVQLKAHAALKDFGGENAGIYLVTSAAGACSSAELWANALENSPRFANPGIFPWTLANAPASLLARELNAQGPNYTMIQNSQSTTPIVQIAQNELLGNYCSAALVILYTIDISQECTLHCSWSIIHKP